MHVWLVCYANGMPVNSAKNMALLFREYDKALEAANSVGGYVRTAEVV